jgi:hypothetical protein
MGIWEKYCLKWCFKLGCFKLGLSRKRKNILVTECNEKKSWILLILRMDFKLLTNI